MHGRFSSARSSQIHHRAQKADADPPAAGCSTNQSTPLHARHADAATTKRARPSYPHHPIPGAFRPYHTALASGHVDIFAASAVSDSRLPPHSASTASSWPVTLGLPAGATSVVHLWTISSAPWCSRNGFARGELRWVRVRPHPHVLIHLRRDCGGQPHSRPFPAHTDSLMSRSADATCMAVMCGLDAKPRCRRVGRVWGLSALKRHRTRALHGTETGSRALNDVEARELACCGRWVVGVVAVLLLLNKWHRSGRVVVSVCDAKPRHATMAG
ncbi:hypothetical protein IWX90DRAFT_171123 [Phyllosticta citrichinensis]|uniref:Uncharacterized protein n=1 Tax=Phyllosticta citrichinensis TaxID=1130410 RepID=A0ABR1Y186_9PEZI